MMARHPAAKREKIAKNFKKDLIFFGMSCIITLALAHRGVAKFGIALGSGPRGHGFKSRHSDHIRTSRLIENCLP